MEQQATKKRDVKRRTKTMDETCLAPAEPATPTTAEPLSCRKVKSAVSHHVLFQSKCLFGVEVLKFSFSSVWTHYLCIACKEFSEEAS
jgi:hypothetical protein